MSDVEFQIAEDEYDAFIPGNYFQGGKNLHHPTKDKPMTGIERITQERLEQKTKHNHSIKKDYEQYPDYELVTLAEAILANEPSKAPDCFNDDFLNKLFSKSYEELLVIAAALIAAQIDVLNFE